MTRVHGFLAAACLLLFGSKRDSGSRVIPKAQRGNIDSCQLPYWDRLCQWRLVAQKRDEMIESVSKANDRS